MADNEAGNPFESSQNREYSGGTQGNPPGSVTRDRTTPATLDSLPHMFLAASPVLHIQFVWSIASSPSQASLFDPPRLFWMY